ncbi:MAG: type II secretion system protein [Verrucomicrobiota bacterium]
MTNPKRSGFTLIEMLMVIAIMGIVAAMVISMAGAASNARKKGMVDAERHRLMLAIDNYQSKLSFYPPDNGNIAAAAQTAVESYSRTNPLLYELTGAIPTNLGGNYIVNYGNGGTIQRIAFTNVFARGGIANSDAVEPQNFFKPLPLPKDYTNYTAAYPSIFGLLVPVPVTNGQLNFWHYDSSSPYRHNPSTYDLWAEYSIGSKSGQLVIITNGNW